MVFPNLSNREKSILYISIIVISIVVVDKAVLSPLVQMTNNLNETILAQEANLKDAVSILNRKDYIKDKYAEYEKNLKRSSSNEEELGSFSSEIEILARDAGVLIKNIKPLPPEETEIAINYKIDLEIETTAPYLVDFIYQLEKSSDLIKVEKLSMSLKKKGSPALKVALLVTKLLLP